MKKLFVAGMVVTSVGLTLGFAGCGGNNANVMRGENNEFRVVGRGDTEAKALEEAVKQANDYCDDKDKEAVIVEEKKEYSGAVPERSHRTIAKIPVAKGVLTSDEDYSMEVRARCQ